MIACPKDVREWLENGLNDNMPDDLKKHLSDILTNGFIFKTDLEIVREYMRADN